MLKIGIDASRNRSGGARAHIIGILSNIENLGDQIEEIHLWSYDDLLNSIPDYPWLKKHNNFYLNKSIIHQMWWQFFHLVKEAKRQQIDVFLNTDAGTLCTFSPAVTMSRDMLSYEKGEMKRFGYSFQRLRLILLKFIQNYSLKRAAGVIFLTKYASDVIQKSCGKINNYQIINHGISENFRFSTEKWYKKDRIITPIKCIYVSNVSYYKHQDNVAKAISMLRNKNYNITIDFIGGGEGKAQKQFEKLLFKLDNGKKFLTQKDFVKHSDLPGLLKNSDIFIYASSCENMPNTLIEGMCTNLPIACSNRGPMPEVLRDGGVYFDPENVFSIADSLEKLINDEELRFNLSDRAKFLSNEFSWVDCGIKTFNYLISIYKEINRL
jgi:glycosyltransferase involved in cell wall biosynthesis